MIVHDGIDIILELFRSGDRLAGTAEPVVGHVFLVDCDADRSADIVHWVAITEELREHLYLDILPLNLKRYYTLIQ